MQISCYTNADEAELFINGKTLGRKSVTKADGCRVTWEMPFEEGTLTAEVDGASDALSSPGKCETVSFVAEKNELVADGQDIIRIEVALLDNNGNIASAEDKDIYYQLVGDGEIAGIENGNPRDLTCYAEKYRKTYCGRAVVYVRAGETAGTLTLYARTKDGIKASFEMHTI